MLIFDLLLLSVGRAMDAFAVSICKGLSVKQLKPRHLLTAGLYFGGFQALMPLIGWLLGSSFEGLIKNVDHWIAFGLLVFIGANMVRESFGKAEELNDSISPKVMLPLAVATSIDALAVGVTFAFLNVNIWLAIALIGAITFVISAVGVKIGNVFGAKYKSKAELAGGIILIALAIKILVEHLFFGA